MQGWNDRRRAAQIHDLVVLSSTGQDPGTRYQVPRVNGSEVVSRWDMLAAPPDILITNYSMLNVMMMRPRDAIFFEETVRWLEEDTNRVFTLIVDELHMYRGTAGTEVSYLLRNLRDRIGLSSAPDRFRIMTASASLDPTRDRKFIEDFFAKSNTFRFISGETVRPAATSLPLDGAARDDASHLAALDPGDLARASAECFEKHDFAAAIATALLDEKGNYTTLSYRQLGTRVFGDHKDSADAIQGVLRALPSLEGAGVGTKLRAHFFFRNVPGMWACSDPECQGVDVPRDGEIRFGRLLATPSPRCPECNARVLELLYCQDCGDVFLGGFTPASPASFGDSPIAVMPDASEIEKLPDQGKLDRASDNYIIYWPRTAAIADEDRVWDIGAWRYGWVRCRLNPAAGELEINGDDFTGWRFQASPRTGGARAGDSTTAYPTRCPSCSSDWELNAADGRILRLDDPRRLRSPVRGMRTGFEKVNQILLSELMQSLPTQRRSLVAFSDSRQDAAKLSAGISLRHYQDLIRTFFASELMTSASQSVLTQFLAEPDPRLLGSMATRYPHLLEAAGRLIADPADSAARSTIQGEASSSKVRLSDLEVPVANRLLDLGINPGGPTPTKQLLRGGGVGVRVPWTDLLTERNGSPRWRAMPPLSTNEQTLKDRIDASFLTELYDSLSAGAGRDFESIGLGWATSVSDSDAIEIDARSDEALLRSSLRILILLHRIEGLRTGRSAPPPKLREFWAAVDHRFGLAEGSTRERAERAFRAGTASVADYLVLPRNIQIRRSSQYWQCPNCRRRHLVPGVGICTRCFSTLESPRPLDEGELGTDFYAWRAKNGFGEFRLNASELTGQTDRLDAQDRQLRFQGVFLGGGPLTPLTAGIDLLSVTTTMEAGVDIGQLNAVAMSNMPPSRFNYQQRVGRAGRRTTPLALAITICRGRSHDDFYFGDPERITNTPTPRPYLALRQPRIIERVVSAEILRRALAHSAVTTGVDVGEMDPHGAFGGVQDWPRLAPEVRDWIASHQDEVHHVIAVFAGHDSGMTSSAKTAVDTLVDRVTEVAARPHGPDALSERLADSGLLPMFGFPTQVRYLYLREPRSSYPWPPQNVVDREASLAITQFAPQSEIVRDGSVFRVGGIGSFSPTAGNRPPVPAQDPLGPRRSVYSCRACSYLDDAPDSDPERLTCPSCGADDDSFSLIELRQPRGYVAVEERDFDGNFAWVSRNGTSRAQGSFSDLERHHAGGIAARSGPGERFAINDNNGAFFAFSPFQGDRWRGALEARERHSSDPAIALAAVMHTDVAFFEPQDRPHPSSGIQLDIGERTQTYSQVRDANQGLRASWYSLSFLLRRAAAYRLDVQPVEFVAGIHVAAVLDAPTNVRAFLADTLENGAGFCTHLGRDGLSDLIETVEGVLSDWNLPAHAQNCRGSCPDCLRDYHNMPFHTLLDWRLARDMFMAFRGEFVVDEDEMHRAMTSVSRGFGDGRAPSTEGFVLIERAAGTAALAARHPLEAFDTQVAADRLLAAADAAMVAGARTVIACDVFTLDRTPRVALSMIDTALLDDHDDW